MSRKVLKLGALEIQKTAFLLCDLQEKFRPHIKHYKECVKVANKMMEGAKAFKIPVFISEQYPKGLGHTTKDICVSDATMLFEKTSFTMLTPEFCKCLYKHVPSLNAVVICGMESHVCIEQTAIDFLDRKVAVHVLADGVSSRSMQEKRLALKRLRRSGAFIATSENVLFKLLQDKNHSCFKTISKLNMKVMNPKSFKYK